MTQLKRGFTAHPKRGDTAHSRIKRGQPTEVTQLSNKNKDNNENTIDDENNISDADNNPKIDITDLDSQFRNFPELIICLIPNIGKRSKNKNVENIQNVK